MNLVIDRVSVALNRTADHMDVFTTYAEVNMRVKKNSDNPASTQVTSLTQTIIFKLL